MNDEEAKRIIHSISDNADNVTFLYDCYIKLQSYSGPLSQEVSKAMGQIREHCLTQFKKFENIQINPDNAVEIDACLAILENTPGMPEPLRESCRHIRAKLQAALALYDSENSIGNTDSVANAISWDSITEDISPIIPGKDARGNNVYYTTDGFKELRGFFSSLDNESRDEIIKLARIETLQKLSEEEPSADKDANRTRYIKEMNNTFGQISIQLWHEYKRQEFTKLYPEDRNDPKACDAYLDKGPHEIKFSQDTFKDKEILKQAVAAVVCARSDKVVRIAKRTQIKNKTKEIWNKIYEWDDRVTKRHPIMYPAAKSVTIAVSTGMVGSIAYSSYKLSKSVKKSFDNYKSHADMSKYPNYFKYITAKENFNELLDLGKSAALLSVSGYFAGATIAEHGFSAAAGLAGQISQHGIDSIISGNASSGLVDKVKNFNISSFGKDLASNTRVLASTAVSAGAGVATSVNTGMQQRRAELELDNLLRNLGASKFPNDKRTLKLRSSNPHTYYITVLQSNNIRVSSEQQQVLEQKASEIIQKRQEKKKRGWGAGLGTFIGLAGAGLFGAKHNEMELSNRSPDISVSKELASTPVTVDNHNDSVVEETEKQPAYRASAKDNVRAVETDKPADNGKHVSMDEYAKSIEDKVEPAESTEKVIPQEKVQPVTAVTDNVASHQVTDPPSQPSKLGFKFEKVDKIPNENVVEDNQHTTKTGRQTEPHATERKPSRVQEFRVRNSRNNVDDVQSHKVETPHRSSPIAGRHHMYDYYGVKGHYSFVSRGDNMSPVVDTRYLQNIPQLESVRLHVQSTFRVSIDNTYVEYLGGYFHGTASQVGPQVEQFLKNIEGGDVVYQDLQKRMAQGYTPTDVERRWMSGFQKDIKKLGLDYVDGKLTPVKKIGPTEQYDSEINKRAIQYRKLQQSRY